MGRINGANSDYTFDDGQGTVVENKEASPLFMRLYICPNDQPSSLEQGVGFCEGIQETCPEPTKTGHAMIQLHQTAGIILQTDGETMITIPHNGGPIDINGIQIVKSGEDRTLQLGASGPKIELLSGGNINLVPANGGQVLINNVPI